MNAAFPFPIIAVDVGNARTKLGLFHAWADEVWPKPAHILQIDNAAGEPSGLVAWIETLGVEPASWWIGSVNRPAATRLIDWLRAHRPDDTVTLLVASDLPIRIEVPRPDQVGVDRLFDAVAANALRVPTRPAIVVDMGTAITVDLVSSDGVFRGGAILPGMGMSAQALHEFTDQLPLVNPMEWTNRPAAAGASTVGAISSGLFWGAVGAVRELLGQMTTSLASDDSGDAVPDVFLTGGSAAAIVDLLECTARHVPELTLAGIALTARAMTAR